MVTATIRATAATLTASKKAAVQTIRRNRGIRGFKMRTKMKDGRKMPRVDTMLLG
jgi:hypothetical protein